MVKLVVLLVLSLVQCSICVQLRYVNCGSSATVHSVVLQPCSAELCTLYTQHNYTITVNFTARVNHEKAFDFVSIDIAGTGEHLSIHLSPNDACNHGVRCPIQAGLAQIYTYTFTVPITNPMRFAAKWEVKSENDRNAPAIICFVFPAKLLLV